MRPSGSISCSCFVRLALTDPFSLGSASFLRMVSAASKYMFSRYSFSRITSRRMLEFCLASSRLAPNCATAPHTKRIRAMLAPLRNMVISARVSPAFELRIAPFAFTPIKSFRRKEAPLIGDWPERSRINARSSCEVLGAAAKAGLRKSRLTSSMGSTTGATLRALIKTECSRWRQSGCLAGTAVPSDASKDKLEAVSARVGRLANRPNGVCAWDNGVKRSLPMTGGAGVCM
mmetsp:Transcript_31311/g.69053  ORF Transcript_31311/g.69053 Transcript_31311/m.69053 type:complete len:232 (+) Transcript_31311:629-1324(+)